MANLNERLFISLPLDQYFVDKDTGTPLANGTIEFYRDSARNTPKTVYQLSGTEPDYTYTAMPNPITLSAVGNIQNGSGVNKTLYFFPYTGTPTNAGDEIDLYYIVCKNSEGVEQWTREGWPNINAGNDPTQDPFPVQNQLSNPQFTRVLINNDLATTYTVSAATNQRFEFAPDWFFLISGTGSVTVTRTAVAGNSNTVTNPPYYITVATSSGITSCKLTQRMYYNSGLWSTNDNETFYLAGTLAAEAVGGTAGLSMFYTESSGGTPVEILSASVATGSFNQYTGTSTAMPNSSNTNTGQSGYVDIYLAFSPSTTIRLTSVQVVPTLNSGGGNQIQFDPNSANREQALMGDYFIPRLYQKPIKSLLTGWDWTINPAQFAESGSMTTTADYLWDQTIGCKNGSGTIAFARNSVTGGLQLTTSDTSSACYLLQYLSGKEAKKILGTRMSMNLWAYKTSGAGVVTAKVHLYRAPSTASIPTLGTTIGTVDSSGTFTLTAGAIAAGWTEIGRSGLGDATATLNLVSSNTEIYSNQDHEFTGWELTSSSEIGNTQFFAAVITLAYADSGTVVVLNSGNLVTGDIPTRPAPLNTSEVLQELQYYYEKSYDQGVYAGAAVGNGALMKPMLTNPDNTSTATTTFNLKGQVFSIEFKTLKRTAPTISLFSSAGSAAGNVLGAISNNGTGNSSNISSSSWGIVQIGQKGANYECTTAGNLYAIGPVTGNNCYGYIDFHYVADARLGKV